jgi:hypothetical protein
MMINEFIERTGFKPTEYYYHAEIEREYEASDMDKDKWCKQWLKNGGIQKAYDAMCKDAAANKLKVDAYEKRITFLQDKEVDLTEKFEDCKQKLFDANQTIEKLNNERRDLIEFLINSAEEWGASDIRERVISMIGAKEYIRYKIEHDLRLWDLDKKLIMELI